MVVDEDAQEGSDDITVDVVHPDDYDDDGDGYTENEGDCDDSDAATYPSASEQCDGVDNDCDGYLNEDWWDVYEENESSTDAYYLGEIDEDSSWSGSEVTVSGLTLHHQGDEDWLWWWADDEWYDDVDVYVVAEGLTGGDFVIELYMEDGGSWVLQDSDSGKGTLSVSKEGDWASDDDDNWAIRVYASTWPGGSCATTYSLDHRLLVVDWSGGEGTETGGMGPYVDSSHSWIERPQGANSHGFGWGVCHRLELIRGYMGFRAFWATNGWYGGVV